MFFSQASFGPVTAGASGRVSVVTPQLPDPTPVQELQNLPPGGRVVPDGLVHSTRATEKYMGLHVAALFQYSHPHWFILGKAGKQTECPEHGTG